MNGALTNDDLAEMEAVLACISNAPKAIRLAGRNRLLNALRELQGFRAREGSGSQELASRTGGKLTIWQVLDIRARLNAGEVAADVAREYGVSKTTVCGIKAGRRYKNV